MEEDSMELLRRFVRERSEAAFRMLVRRHSGLVYATALRRLAGDRSGAEDVTQEVFTLLARKAAGLERIQLAGWLYRQTCRRTADLVRRESRRRRREQVAVAAAAAAMNSAQDSFAAGPPEAEVQGEIDEALLGLPAADRDALVLRFLEGRDFRGVGHSLGLTEEAARKRVTRALEKLTALLQRRGLVTAAGTPRGGVALGGMLAGLQAKPGEMPEALMDRVAARALEALPAAAPAPLLGTLRPVVAGALLSSLIAGAVLLVERPPERAGAKGGVAGRGGESRADREEKARGVPVTAEGLASVIEEIRRAKAGPEYVLSALRLEAVLARVSLAQIPELIALADERLGVAERRAAYALLLQRWMEQDPVAALDFAVAKDLTASLEPKGGGEFIDEMFQIFIGRRVAVKGGSDPVSELFQGWLARDPQGAEAWLQQHWRDESLGRKALDGSLRELLARDLTDGILRKDGMAAALASLDRLPAADRTQVLAALCGGSSWHEGWQAIDAGGMALLRERLAGLADTDPVQARLLERQLWTGLGSKRPEELRGWLAGMTPRERLEGMVMLAVDRRVDPAQEQALVEAAVAEGVSRREAMSFLAIEKADTASGMKRFVWLDQHAGEVEVQDWLLQCARGNPYSSMTVVGDEPDARAIECAVRLEDPEMRRAIARAAYRRMWAREPARAAEFLEQRELPADLKAELATIREGAR